MSNSKISIPQEQNSIQVVYFDSSMINLTSKIDKPQGVDITFQNISYSVDILDEAQSSVIPCKKTYKKKQILKNISGIFKAGTCTAIMGASGAGKTTLLNILSCRIQHAADGKLYANQFMYNYDSFGDFANYVMQSDVLMQTLTVRETLIFAARLKLNLSEQEQKLKVLEIANQMKLQKCLDTLVGGVIIKGISGGERKRTSIAVELISDPTVIFLDEPTSGLDSLTSYIIVSRLKKLAHTMNKTVIMTIHQPNSQTYQLFDNLTLLLQGKIIYQGEASKVTDYWTKNFLIQCPQFINPPDFIMAKIHHQDQKNLTYYPKYFSTYQQLQQNPVQNQIDNRKESQIQLRVSTQTFLQPILPLLHRNFLNTVRNPMLLRSKIFQGIFISLFVGGLFFNVGGLDYSNRQEWYSVTGFMFFITISGLMSFLSPVTLTFPAERDVFFKQQDSKMYTIGQYFLARNINQIPQLIIIPLLMQSIYYFMINLAPTAGQFFLHYLIFILMGLCGSSLGLLIGSVVLDAKSISAVVPLLLMPIVLFSGFFKNRASLPVWLGWIEYILKLQILIKLKNKNFDDYIFKIFGWDILVFDFMNIVKCQIYHSFQISPNKYAFTAYMDNQVQYRASLIQILDFDVSKWQAIGILFALGIVFRVLSVFFLWLLKKKMQ